MLAHHLNGKRRLIPPSPDATPPFTTCTPKDTPPPTKKNRSSITNFVEFFHNGTKEVLKIREAPQKEEFIRHWLQAITEFCKHQLDYEDTLIVRLASNKTPVYLDRVPIGSRQQYLHEPIITLACQSGTYKAHSEIVAKPGRFSFKLTGNHKMSHPLTLQGFHYEIDHSFIRRLQDH